MTNATATDRHPSATWMKLRDGSWGLRVKGTGLRAGDRVDAVRKNGSSSVETIASVAWTGEGVTLATIVASAKQARSSRSGRTGWTDDHGLYLVNGDFHCTRPGCWCGGYDSL